MNFSGHRDLKDWSKIFECLKVNLIVTFQLRFLVLDSYLSKDKI